MQQRFRAFGGLGLLLGTFLLLAHCGGDNLTLPSETAPANLELLDGNNQSGAAGEPLALPLVVKVTDRRGLPAPSQRVAFLVATEAPGALVVPDTAETAGDGRAQALWTLGGVSGVQSVVARVVGLDGVEVRFDAVVGSSGAARIESVSGDGQTGAVGTALDDSLVVRVLDRFGNTVAGVSVDWGAEQGSVDPASVVTGADGRAATYRILGSSTGDQTATASSLGLEGSPVTFTSHAVAGSADRLVKVSGDNQSAAPGAELSNPLVVRLVDEAGNGVPNRPVSWVVGAGDGSVASTNTNTGSDGEASTRWTLGSTGTNTLNAVVSGVGFVTFTAQAVSGGGGGGGGGGDGGDGGDGGSAQPDRLEFRVQPSETKEKKKITPPVEVAVLDQQGNLVTSGSIEVKLDLVGDRRAKLHGGSKEQTRSGIATFSDLSVDREGDYRLRASADGLPSVDSDRFEVKDD